MSAEARCKTCRHFAVDRHSNEWEVGFGSCRRALDFSRLTDLASTVGLRAWQLLEQIEPPVLAMTSDAEDYASYLHVKPEFGCVLHEVAS